MEYYDKIKHKLFGTYADRAEREQFKRCNGAAVNCIITRQLPGAGSHDSAVNVCVKVFTMKAI